MTVSIQNSYAEESIGKLYIVPTPIGNLEDITFRAVNILKDVDYIAAEDTRHTQKLLNHFDIQKQTISYHEHNKESRTSELIDKLIEGHNLALVSDAGMPAISDPGYELVKAAVEKGISVVVLPGANAAVSALVGSGLPTEKFYFYGFLPRKKQQIEKELLKLKKIEETIIFYESPFRVKQTLQMVEKVYGDRRVVLVRELSKIHEQYVRASVKELLDYLNEHDVKGECCIILEGATHIDDHDENWWQDLSIKDHVAYYEKEGIRQKEALKKVALDRNIPKKIVYHEIHVKK